MINCIDIILNILIKILALCGFSFIIYKYIRIIKIDKEIDNICKKYENEIEIKCGPGSDAGYRGENYIEKEIKKILNKRDLEKESLERERKNIISTLPFLK